MITKNELITKIRPHLSHRTLAEASPHPLFQETKLLNCRLVRKKKRHTCNCQGSRSKAQVLSHNSPLQANRISIADHHHAQNQKGRTRSNWLRKRITQKFRLISCLVRKLLRKWLNVIVLWFSRRLSNDKKLHKVRIGQLLRTLHLIERHPSNCQQIINWHLLA